MSITFYSTFKDADGDYIFNESNLNISNVNASELFVWLGMVPNLWTADPVRADWLAPLCRRKLWGNVARNEDQGVETVVEDRIHWMGRRPGYLGEKTRLLLLICENAMETDKDAHIYWA